MTAHFTRTEAREPKVIVRFESTAERKKFYVCALPEVCTEMGSRSGLRTHIGQRLAAKENMREPFALEAREEAASVPAW